MPKYHLSTRLVVSNFKRSEDKSRGFFILCPEILIEILNTVWLKTAGSWKSYYRLWNWFIKMWCDDGHDDDDDITRGARLSVIVKMMVQLNLNLNWGIESEWSCLHSWRTCFIQLILNIFKCTVCIQISIWDKWSLKCLISWLLFQKKEIATLVRMFLVSLLKLTIIYFFLYCTKLSHMLMFVFLQS